MSAWVSRYHSSPPPPPIHEGNLWGLAEQDFIDRMSFLSPNHQCQSTEGNTKQPHPLFTTGLLKEGTLLPLYQLTHIINIYFM